MTNELKPCPFCGSDAFATYKTGEIDGLQQHSVLCKNRCGGQMQGQHYDEQSAVAAWNARAKP